MSENGTCKNCYWRDGTDCVCINENSDRFMHYVPADRKVCLEYEYDDGECDPDDEYADFLEEFPESEDDE